MKNNRLILIILLISTFLLNSTPLLAYSPVSAHSNIQEVLSKKDEAFIEKFDNARKWIEEQKPAINQFFANSFVKFKNEIDRIVQEIRLQIEKLSNRNHTRL